jgi:hypothetical protein
MYLDLWLNAINSFLANFFFFLDISRYYLVGGYIQILIKVEILLVGMEVLQTYSSFYEKKNAKFLTYDSDVNLISQPECCVKSAPGLVAPD